MPAIIRRDGRTLQNQVVDQILARIRSGELATGDPLLPERQLSAELGVSRITVVRALDRLEADGWVSRQQGRGTFVSEPPTLAKGPAIALMAAVPAHPSLFRSLIGMSQVINAADGQLRLLGSFEGLGSERDMVDRALGDGADGLIIYPASGTAAPPLYHDLVRRGVPLVLIDRYFRDLSTDRVIYDDETAGAELCGRLFDSGVRRIAVLPHREFDVTSVQGRIAGARRAAEARSLPADAITLWPEVYADFSPSRPMRGAPARHLDRLQARLQSDPVQGLFAINGDVAERLSRDLQTPTSGEAAARCPRICACVHQQVSGPFDMPVLMAHENAEDLGRRAGDLLVRRVENPGDTTPETVRIRMTVDVTWA
jgi:DNA-binding LacI/PurR family transcriptional regulator